MKILKQQIKESFFNPILHFLPLLVFVAVDDVWGLVKAWKISFPVAIFVLFYIRFYYKRIYVWNIFLSLGYLAVGIFATVFSVFLSSPSVVVFLIDEIVFLLLLLFAVFGKSIIEKIGEKSLSRQVPLSNNINEFIRVTKVLIFVVLFYVVFTVLISFEIVGWFSQTFIGVLYISLLIICVLDESFRVYVIRKKLLAEDWLPVMNAKGKVIGTSQHIHRKNVSSKRFFPVVRCYFLDNGKILLHQRKYDNDAEPLLWDATLTKHVRMGLSVENVLSEQMQKIYGVKSECSLFLAKYIYEADWEKQLIFLFATCKTDIQPTGDDYERLKWWTTHQIEDNLGKGVFTERFENEYHILKRSGLTEMEGCNCDCKLKSVVYK